MRRKHPEVKNGDVFDHWTVLGKDYSRNRPAFLCLCRCGRESVVFEQNLTRRLSTKCTVCAWVTHGQSKESPEYLVWAGMKARCLNPKGTSYEQYGGRGVSICDEWLGEHGFENFLAHVGKRPSPEHSLDRFPDKDGNYEPGNVRWATAKQQARNTRSNRYLTMNGQTKSVAEWAEELTLNPNLLHGRIGHGWADERVLTQPREIHRRGVEK